MRPNDESARAVFRRCSPIAWPSASSAALALVLLTACGSTAGGGAVSPSPSARAVAFTEVAATSQARDDSGEMIIVGTTDASRAKIAQLLPNAATPSGRVLVAVFQGQQNTGGYSAQLTAIERSGALIFLPAAVGAPPHLPLAVQVLETAPHRP